MPCDNPRDCAATFKPVCEMSWCPRTGPNMTTPSSISLREFLQEHHLADFHATLVDEWGAAVVEDLAALADAELDAMGMKPLQSRRLRRALAGIGLGPQAQAAADPKPGPLPLRTDDPRASVGLQRGIGPGSSAILFLDARHLSRAEAVNFSLGAVHLLSEYRDPSAFVGWVSRDLFSDVVPFGAVSSQRWAPLCPRVTQMFGRCIRRPVLLVLSRRSGG